MHAPVLGLGDTAAIEAQITQWVQTLNGLNRALAQAKAANNDLMVAQVRTAIAWVLRQIANLNAQIRAEEMPSSLLQALDRVSDQALKLAANVGGVAEDAVNAVRSSMRGIGMTVGILPLLLVGALVVLGIGITRGTVTLRR